jgi:tripartite-type tricarboxylate transporter receptor subunit TctC
VAPKDNKHHQGEEELIMKAWLVGALTAASLGSTGPAAVAQEFPTRELQGVIMWGAGGATDNVARALTPHVEEALGQKIVLVNRPGGAGAIATQYVNSRPADGYTLLYGAENPQLHGVLGLSQLDYGDFFPANVIARGVAVIVANSDAPWNSFDELVEDVQARPGEVKMGSTGPGGLPDVVSSLIGTLTDFEVTAVPFDGEGPGITALQGGHVDFMPSGLTAVQEQIRAGRVKPLAVVSAEPVPTLEGVPPITEALPDFTKYLPWGPFYGVFVKEGTPEEVTATLVEAFHAGVADGNFQEFIVDFGAIPMNVSGDEARDFLDRYQSVTAWALHEAGAAKVSPEEFGIPPVE